MFLFAEGFKRPHQQVTATTPAGNTKFDRLLYIQDLKSIEDFYLTHELKYTLFLRHQLKELP